MSEYIVQSGSLTAVANKIREKTGDSAPLEFPNEFVAAIDGLSAGLTPPETPTDSILFYSPSPISIRLPITKVWNASLYFSTDHINWTEISQGVYYNAELHDDWYKIYIRGVGNSIISNNSNGSAWKITGSNIKCVGDLKNLLDYTTTPVLSSHVFAYIFYKCGNVDFDIEMSFSTMPVDACQHMFEECVSLTKCPDLPATVIQGHCYDSMFKGCISITSGPQSLPAEILQSGCYSSMFQDCLSLITPSKIQATTLANLCCSSMYRNCVNLDKIPELRSTVMKQYCYDSMFRDCPKIKISATQVDDYQNEYRIPSVGEGTDYSGALGDMFTLTGGTFTGSPTINTTYYTSNTVIPAT